MNVELVEGGRISPKWESEQEWIPVELASGDLLIFGSHLAHRSAANNTSKSRSSVYATYHNVSDGTDLRARYYVDRRENFPPDHGTFSRCFLPVVFNALSSGGGLICSVAGLALTCA